MKARKGRIGSSFDDHLKEEGIYEEVTARAMKRVLARQLAARQSRASAATPGSSRPSSHSRNAPPAVDT